MPTSRASFCDRPPFFAFFSSRSRALASSAACSSAALFFIVASFTAFASAFAIALASAASFSAFCSATRSAALFSLAACFASSRAACFAAAASDSDCSAIFASKEDVLLTGGVVVVAVPVVVSRRPGRLCLRFRHALATAMNSTITTSNSCMSIGKACSKYSENSDALITPSWFSSILFTSLVFLSSVHEPSFCPRLRRALPSSSNSSDSIMPD